MVTCAFHRFDNLYLNACIALVHSYVCLMCTCVCGLVGGWGDG